MGGLVVDGPETADDLAGTGGLEGAAQPVEAFARFERAAGGLAAGENDQFSALKGEARDLLGGQKAVGEDEAGAKKGVTGQECLAGLLAFVGEEKAVGGEMDDALAGGAGFEGGFRGGGSD